jgi:hypothetical protein
MLAELYRATGNDFLGEVVLDKDLVMLIDEELKDEKDLHKANAFAARVAHDHGMDALYYGTVIFVGGWGPGVGEAEPLSDDARQRIQSSLEAQ